MYIKADGSTLVSDINSDSYLDMAFGGSGSHGLGGPNGSHHQRTKRMRTSFKHHQLRTMKTYFTVNHNPDAKDLKQLSQKTGLAKRVLQVIFESEFHMVYHVYRYISPRRLLSASTTLIYINRYLNKLYAKGALSLLAICSSRVVNITEQRSFSLDHLLTIS